MARRGRFGLAAAVVLIGALTVSLGPSARAAEPTAYPGGTWTPPAATYGVVAERNVNVTMSDGAVLVADVFRPGDPVTGAVATGSFPVLLTQTPYTGSIGVTALADADGPGEYFVQRGYVFASVDVRGTGRSGGNGEFFGERDAQDGVELVDWAAGLPSSNGIVGLHGCSYLGHTQVYTAAKLGPGSPVKAAIPACVSSDPYRDTYFENGIPAPSWEGAGLAAGTLLGPTIEAYMVPKYLDSQAGGPTAYDAEFWDVRDHLDDVPALVESGIPMLIWNGWRDSGFGGLELWSALQHEYFDRPAYDPLRPGQRTTGRYQLLLGDWTHGGGLDQGVELQWYETWLKGVPTGLEATPTIGALHVQDQTTKAWVNAGGYPMTDAAVTFPVSGGSLQWGPPEGGGTSYTVDFPERPGVLAGPGAVALDLVTSGTDAQIHVELLDVASDGTTALVSHGGALASMRAVDTARSWQLRPFLSLTGESPVVPGEPVHIELALQPTMWTMPAGHHLRLVVASQPSPQLCFQKMTEITTDAVGCRPRSAVLTRLAGTTATVSGGSLVLPLAPLDSFTPVRTGVTDGGVVLPMDWSSGRPRQN